MPARQHPHPGMVSLHPKDQEIPGLFHTGQDLLTAGVFGALMSGFITAHAVLGYDWVDLLVADRNLAIEKFKTRAVLILLLVWTLMFSTYFALIEKLTFLDGVWFALCTFTTIGLGDVTPSVEYRLKALLAAKDIYNAAVEVMIEKSKGLFIYAAMADAKITEELSSGMKPTLADLKQYPDGLDEFYEEQLELKHRHLIIQSIDGILVE